MTRRAGTALIVAFVALVAACGGDDLNGDTSTTAAAHGWIGGEPAWRTDRSGDGDVEMAAPAAGASEAAAAADGGGISGEPEPPEAATGPLRAGSVDDNAAFADFLAYLERVEGVGISGRPFDPSGRVLIHVEGADGRPVDGAAISISGEGLDAPALLQSDATGAARYLPAADLPATTFTVTVGDQTATAERGSEVTLTLGVPGGASVGVPLDVMFVLDATGSMGDEIAQLRSTMIEVAERLAAVPAAPDIRFGMTVYRDEGDAFVTSVFDFTGDVAAFTAALDAVAADGGGDAPEALDEALAAALGEPSWRDPATTVQLMFVVADAPPHVDRQVETPYTRSIADAAARGVTIHAIAASNTDDQAELVLRQLAQATGGRFVFLAYDNGATATGEHTDIEAIDYEELPLGDLVVRLVSETLDGLVGGETPAPPGTTVPPETTVAPTNPPGQD